MTENAVREFLTFWSACPDVACLVDVEGRVLATNAVFDELVGGVRGSDFLQLVAYEVQGEIRALFRNIVGGQKAPTFSTTANTRSGDAIHLLWRAWQTQAADGSIVMVATTTSVDRTLEVNGEELLRAHRIIDTSPTFVVAIDAAGLTTFMNSTMLRAIGYSREEVTGKNYLEMFVPSREHALLGQIFQQLTSPDQNTLNENHVLTREGEEILVEWHGRPIFDRNGRLQFFYGVGFDVTEQRRTLNDLLRSQQRLALHFKQSPLGMIEWDRDFRVTDWNPAAERIFGYSREEALGKYGQDLVVPEPVRPYVADVWQELLESRGAVNAHNENVTKDGRTIVCEWSNTTLVDATGEVMGVASLVNDVTDRKKAEEDLRERERVQAVTIQQLSVPIIDIWDGILALPIVGTIDESRAMRMTEALLEAIVRTGTRVAILDLTGATAVDAAIANHLGAMIRATRLIGSECFVSGLGPEIARKLVEFDIALSVRTFGSLRAALRQAIRNTRS